MNCPSCNQPMYEMITFWGCYNPNCKIAEIKKENLIKEEITEDNEY